MTDLEETTTARITRHFDVSPQQVFNAWLDVQKVRQWFGPGLGTVVCVDIDARPDGSFVIVQQRGEREVEHTGEYLEVVPPRRLAFSWRVPPSDTSSRVVVDIVPSTTGSEMLLTHELPGDAAQQKEGVEDAWRQMLDVMARVI